MEDHDKLSAIKRANLRHERERIRTIGWIGLGLGLFCWISGGMFLFLVSSLGAGNGDAAVFAAFFGFGAAIGCVFATRARQVSKEAMPHAVLALILNGAFLILAITLVWL